jgi:hypothetical protein
VPAHAEYPAEADEDVARFSRLLESRPSRFQASNNTYCRSATVKSDFFEDEILTYTEEVRQ